MIPLPKLLPLNSSPNFIHCKVGICKLVLYRDRFAIMNLYCEASFCLFYERYCQEVTLHHHMFQMSCSGIAQPEVSVLVCQMIFSQLTLTLHFVTSDIYLILLPNDALRQNNCQRVANLTVIPYLCHDLNLKFIYENLFSIIIYLLEWSLQVWLMRRRRSHTRNLLTK